MSWIHVSQEGRVSTGGTRRPSLKTTVAAYIACGREHGFAYAEALLNHFTPKGILEGKCYDVPPAQRAAFIEALKDPRAFLERPKK